MRGGLHVSETGGERWDLAIELLGSGTDAVAIENVVLRRRVSGPDANGRVVASIVTRHDPRAVSIRQAQDEISSGLALVERLRAADDRFDGLLREHGIDVEFIYDYDTGSVLLADVGEDGSIAWAQGWIPDA